MDMRDLGIFCTKEALNLSALCWGVLLAAGQFPPGAMWSIFGYAAALIQQDWELASFAVNLGML